MIDKAQIQQVAADSLNSHTCLTVDGTKSVEVTKFATCLGLIFHTPAAGTYGLTPTYVSAEGRPAFISLPRTITGRAHRVELAHRIGHHLLHREEGHTAVFCQPRYALASLCAEATVFAREFLLPEEAVRELEANGGGATAVSYTFEVPLDVAEKRLQDLGLMSVSA